MTSIDETLAERGSRYGSFQEQARLEQRIKAAVATGRNWGSMGCDNRSAVELIITKLSRMLTGDPEYADNFHDIAGYAKLVEDRILSGKAPEPVSDEGGRNIYIRTPGDIAWYQADGEMPATFDGPTHASSSLAYDDVLVHGTWRPDQPYVVWNLDGDEYIVAFRIGNDVHRATFSPSEYNKLSEEDVQNPEYLLEVVKARSEKNRARFMGAKAAEPT